MENRASVHSSPRHFLRTLGQLRQRGLRIKSTLNAISSVDCFRVNPRPPWEFSWKIFGTNDIDLVNRKTSAVHFSATSCGGLRAFGVRSGNVAAERVPRAVEMGGVWGTGLRTGNPRGLYARGERGAWGGGVGLQGIKEGGGRGAVGMCVCVCVK